MEANLCIITFHNYIIVKGRYERKPETEVIKTYPRCNYTMAKLYTLWFGLEGKVWLKKLNKLCTKFCLIRLLSKRTTCTFHCPVFDLFLLFILDKFNFLFLWNCFVISCPDSLPFRAKPCSVKYYTHFILNLIFRKQCLLNTSIFHLITPTSQLFRCFEFLLG